MGKEEQNHAINGSVAVTRSGAKDGVQGALEAGFEIGETGNFSKATAFARVRKCLPRLDSCWSANEQQLPPGFVVAAA
jgi:hypothetical protein